MRTLIDVPTPSCHASCVALAGDKVLVTWFGGAREGAGDVGIYLARRINGRWEAPRLVASETDMPHWNPVLFARGDDVTLFYKAGRTIPRWRTRVMRSRDGGATFSRPAELVPGDEGGRGPVRNKPLMLASGAVACPASVETESEWNAFCDVTDAGFSRMTRGENVPLRRGADGVKGRGVIQPTLWQSADGVLHMLLRSTEGYVFRSESCDGGLTWREAYPTALPNNNSGIDLTRAADGALYLALNPVSGDWAARSPLEIWRSADDGDTFVPWQRLENEPYEYSYPSVTADESTLYVSYTWRREKIALWETAIR